MELLTINECATFLRSSTRAIHKWIRQKEDPLPVFYAGSKPLFDQTQVIEWLKRNSARHTEVGRT